MAEIERFPECNFVLGAPRTMREVQDLPCHRHEGGGGGESQRSDSDRGGSAPGDGDLDDEIPF